VICDTIIPKQDGKTENSPTMLFMIHISQRGIVEDEPTYQHHSAKNANVRRAPPVRALSAGTVCFFG